MIRKRTFTAAWALSAIVILALATCGCKRAAHAPQMGLPEVMVMDVVQKDVSIYGDWIGTLDGMVNAQILSLIHISEPTRPY